jgi:AcrR family transcriptional regulator
MVQTPANARDGVEPVSVSRLLAAAVEAFAERGFHGTTTRDIAARADLSSAAIYMHYRSKTELLYLIMRDAHETLLREMEDAAEKANDPATQLSRIVRAHVEFHAKSHTAARVANHELPALETKQREEIIGLRRRIEDIVTETLVRGVEASVFYVRDVRATTFLILSIGIGVSRWFRADGRLSPTELGDLYAELVARMVTR